MPSAYKFFLPVFFVILNLSCFGQQDNNALNAQSPSDTFETHLKSSLKSWYSKYPKEKVFVHTSQDYYSSGETIWYKVYALSYGKPSTISKIIYVRLTDTAGNLIVQNMHPLIDGKANGNIDIGQKLKAGWYQLSAFTSWMMNFDQEAYYQQRIYIGNLSDSTLVRNNKEAIKKTYRMMFYPEGGNLVDGNVSRIAFYASDENGLPADVEGTVKDDLNKSSLKISTTHNGMGDFAMAVSAARVYTANIRFPDGSWQNLKLPAAKAAGIALRVSQKTNAVHLEIGISGTTDQFQNGMLSAIQDNGQLFTYPLHLSNGINRFDLLDSIFSTGILKLTVFDDRGLPQAERIVFINKHDLQSTRLKTDTLSFLPRAINAFTALISDEAGNPVAGNFSVAVTDGDAFTVESEQNIFSALLLSPELKGKVCDPGYYFKNESDSLARQLDLVMLTNGWRHFSWQKTLSNENFTIQHPVERSAYVAGKINGFKSLPAAQKRLNIKVMMIGQDSAKSIGYLTPDSAGRFIIKDFPDKGVSDIYLQEVDQKNRVKKLPIQIFTSLNDSLKNVKGIAFEDRPVPSLTRYYLSAARKQEQGRIFANGIVLKTVEVKDKKVTPVERLIAQHVSPKYTSDREFTLDLVNNPTVDMSLIEYMKGRFPGLQIYGDADKPIFVYRGGNTLQKLSSKNSLPYFYVNEALVQYTSISDMTLNDVALIRFMPPPVWFAPFNGGNEGAIMIYTKKNTDEVKRVAGLADNFDHYLFNGFSITREFSSPDYTERGTKGDILKDNRLTLYWNHDLNTDSHSELKFRFYNSGTAKKFKVTIQGMDAQGRLIYLQQILQ